MHELAVAASIAKTAQEALIRNGLSSITAIHLRIGELTCIDEKALRVAMQGFCQSAPFTNARLEIQFIKPSARCRNCSNSFSPEEFTLQCPYCGAIDAELVTGTELYIHSIEAE